MIVLDQNYRSTQHILDAANAVIANNPSRRPKQLWTEQVGGELIIRYHAEDEHDEASYITREISRLVDSEGYRFGDVAVFYRTNAQSRVVEESLVRVGHPLPRGRRHEVLRPPRDQGHPRLPARAGEPRRRGELAAHRQHAQARRRRHVDQPGRRLRAGRGAHVPRGAARGERRRRHRQGARRHPRPARAAGGVRGAPDGGVGDVVEAVLSRTGYVAELEAERSIEARAASRTCRSSWACAASSTRRSTRRRRRASRPSPAWARPRTPRATSASRRARPRPGVPRGVSLVTDLDADAEGGEQSVGHADDAAHGQGSRVPRRVHDRHGRRRVPPRAIARRSRRARGGTPPLLRRHHPGP